MADGTHIKIGQRGANSEMQTFIVTRDRQNEICGNGNLNQSTHKKRTFKNALTNKVQMNMLATDRI
jgi:hypothetical protein